MDGVLLFPLLWIAWVLSDIRDEFRKLNANVDLLTGAVKRVAEDIEEAHDLGGGGPDANIH